MDVLLLEPQLLQGESRRNLHLRLHNVHTRDLLGHGVLHLHARVHLDKDVVALLIHEELNRAGTFIVDVLTELHGIRTDAITQLRIQRRRRSNLHNLLVATLYGAVTLIEMHDVALRVTQNLHLDVLRADDGGLKVNVTVTEGSLRFTGSLCTLSLKLCLILNEAHTAAAATSNCLDEDGIVKFLRVLY